MRSFFAGLFVSAFMFAQVRDTGSIFGSVSDPQSALMPGVKVTLTNAGTGSARTAATDANGGYLFPLLPVGSYNLEVEQAGFRKYERKGIVLQANENVRVDAALAVGNVQETVSVEASGATVDTRSATLNHTVDQRQVVESDAGAAEQSVVHGSSVSETTP